MRHRKIFCILLLGAVFMVARSFGETIHVYLIGGQSNANGHAKAEELPGKYQDPREDIFYLYRSSNNTSVGPGSLITRATFGPEVTFGREMADFHAVSGDKVAIFQFAVGGSNLNSHWKAGGSKSPENDGPLYKSFQQTVDDGMTALKEANPKAEIVIEGMLWMQGEADANAEASGNYEKNLKDFIEDIRKTYDKKLPFYIGRLSEKQTALKEPYLDTVRSAQDAVAKSLSYTYIISTDRFDLYPDNLHFNADGMRKMGEAFASAVKSSSKER